MKRTFLAIVLVVSATLLTDCLIAYPTVPPPSLRAEVILASPGPGFVWIAGYWGWRSGGYYWVPGHYVRARPGRAWAPGRWEQRGHRWVWRRGRWK